MKTVNTGNNGVLGLLGVLFIGLKLTGFIDWSWWWVTAPFWGGLALLLIVFGIAAIVRALGGKITLTKQLRKKTWHV